MSMGPASFAARRAAFARLHESGCFVIPNPWDAGTARYLRHLGFAALATTSAGFQFSRGRPDAIQKSDLEAVLAHVAGIVAATDLPVNADFQAGYADDPDDVAANVTRCVATGVAGLSIEDATGDPRRPLHDIAFARDRIAAARAAIDATGAPVLLTARAESYLVGQPEPLADVLRRLTAYAEAGADVLYAPGPRQPEALQEIIRAVAPLPVNVLVSADIGLTVPEIADLGARRISVGSALARVAWGAFMQAAQEIATAGTFGAFAQAATFADLDRIFGAQDRA